MMRAVVYVAPGQVEVRRLVEPRLQGPRDAVVRVNRSAICGTDLHPYRGRLPGFTPGTVLGHEFAGTVHDAGPDVPFTPGDRVFASDVIACGDCAQCRLGRHYQCASVSLFGYADVVGSPVAGGQADLVRVPFADVVLCRTPDDVTDEQAVFVGDLLSTAYAAVRNADVRAGGTVAVVGSGPLGLLAAMCAAAAGAAETVVADPDPARRERASAFGFAAVPPDELPGVGAGSVIEAVGTDEALLAALAASGPGAAVALAGSHHSTAMPFPSGLAFARELTLRFTVGDPISVRGEVLALIRSGAVDPAQVISHRYPLVAAAAAYSAFHRHQALKIVLCPELESR